MYESRPVPIRKSSQRGTVARPGDRTRVWTHFCENLGAYGVTTHGGIAEYCAVHADAVHRVGDLSFAEAALAEPMGCELNGLAPL